VRGSYHPPLWQIYKDSIWGDYREGSRFSSHGDAALSGRLKAKDIGNGNDTPIVTDLILRAHSSSFHLIAGGFPAEPISVRGDVLIAAVLRRLDP
jgi:hypothetical protein